MVMLRERGIYRLPDLRDYVLSQGSERVWFLFSGPNWAIHGAVSMRINHDGTISAKGNRTAWTVDDLVDTGRTANHPSRYS
jgi:hypothetical protein